jgi:hypothetical protein
MKINRLYKKIFSLETYEDLLVMVLRFFIVHPYYFFKNHKYKNLFKLSTYEDLLVKLMHFFMRRSPLYLLFALKSYILNPKSPQKGKTTDKFDLFNRRHPFVSTGTSIFSYLFIFSSIAYLLFTTFYKSAAADWWNDDWLYRKQITINSSQVTADLTNFPVLVSITDGDLASKAQSDGDDIVFTIDQGNKLDHEIESFDETTGTLTAWVKIPELDGDQDSKYYMYYGNPTTDAQEKPEEVWDENYKLVQHMNEDGTGTRYDSTRNNNDGTTSGYDGDEATDSGQVNGADDFDNTNDNVQIADNSTLGGMAQLTVEAWVNLDQLPSTT